MSYGSPVVDRIVLTQTLRRLRGERGEKQATVARALEWSVSKLTRIENGGVNISRSDLEFLLRHYRVEDEEMISELTDLARGARAIAWWSKYKITDKAFETYIGYEAAAASIRMAQTSVIPGLLQTERYARYVITADTDTSTHKINEITNLRLDRQRHVFERNVEQEHILDEAVLRRRVDDVMTDQLHHLVEVAQMPNVSIRVIPLSAPLHFGLRGPFTLLGFDAVPLDDVLYFESGRRGDLLIAPVGGDTIGPPTSLSETAIANEIAAHQDGFESMKRLALGPEESRVLMEQIVMNSQSKLD
jgi:transcriptional regulator with XRE-family HTH domain